MEQPTVVCHVSDITVNFQATLKDVLVCDVVLMALTFTPLPVLPSTEHVAVFFFLLHVLEVFGLNATLIFSLIIIIIIIHWENKSITVTNICLVILISSNICIFLVYIFIMKYRQCSDVSYNVMSMSVTTGKNDAGVAPAHTSSQPTTLKTVLSATTSLSCIHAY